jgi:5-(carboxyamino)imidazole ribonucleotide synthase
MINLLGDLWPAPLTSPDWTPVLSHPRAKLHLYGKASARSRRKMGHINVVGETVEEALENALQIKHALPFDR